MKSRFLLAMFMSLQVWLSSCFNSNKVASAQMQKDKTTITTSFYDLKARSIDGKEIKMSSYKGKKIVILNTASKCGYTSQYADWQKFYEANKENVVVLGFPCNQFMGQEPGSAQEISNFCQLNYGVTFPMFEKVNVKGDQQNEIFQWLSNPEKNGWCSEIPSWNFCKYLIDENGNLTHFFASKIKPDSPEFTAALQTANKK